MVVKLDVKDRKILYELDRNARIPFSELGRLVGVSKEVARYRLIALESAEVIFKYFSIIDMSKLGYTNFKAFIKLQNASEQQEAELLSWLTENDSVMWLVSCDGQFDIAFGMRAKNIEDYAKKLSELDAKFGRLFLQRQIAPIVKGQYFNRDYLVGAEAGTEKEMSFGSVPQKSQLDEIDWGILVTLGKNARITIAEIARQTKTSPDVAAKRLKRLEGWGILQNYVLMLDNLVLGQIQYKVLVRLSNLTEKRYKTLVEFCRRHPNIIYVVKTFGPWEFEMDMEVQNVQNFRTIMRQFKEAFSDIISDYSYITIYKIHKYNFCPAPMLESGPPVREKG